MSDVDSPVKPSAVKGKKKRVITSDDEDEPAAPSAGAASASTSAINGKAKEPSKKAKPAAPLASIFAKPEPKAKPAPAASSSKPAAVDKAGKPVSTIFGKPAKADPKKVVNDRDEDGAMDVDRASPVKAENADEEGEEEMSDEEEEEEKKQRGKAAVKLHKSGAVADQGWKEGEPVPYSSLAKTFEKIEATTKRLEITEILTQFLLVVAKRDTGTDVKTSNLLKVVYLCINRGIELGIGESLLVKAIAESTGRATSKIKEDLRKEGDLGKVAMPTMFKPKPLTVPYVFQSLTEIAKASGNASQAKKVGIIKKMLSACQDQEAKFIVRSLEGKLRIGLAERTLVLALAQAMVLKTLGDKKVPHDVLAQKLEQGAEVVKSIYSELPTYDLIVPALMKGGIDGLRENCKLTPGVPLKPMLAKPTKAITEVLDRFEGKEFTCEYKYDGERAQVHLLEDGSIAVFSRNSENMSAKYPDLVEQIPRCIKPGVKSFVIDAEAVAFDLETKKLLPFQDLSRRKRKDVRTEDITVRVHLFAFDLLYLNGESVLTRELKDRRALLREHFQFVEGEFDFAKSSDGSTTDEIQAFLEESVKDGCEGLMVKMLTTDASTYEPSRRSINWLKLKKDYLSGVGDSLDLVVVGAYHGKGKRTAVYGAFLLACYDPDAERYQTICKIGTGFSEEVLTQFHALLAPLETERARGDIDVGGAKPDVWFEPKVVWEVLTADLSLSPVYTAARGLVEARGISLRFPRFLRVRDDKGADDATTAEQVAEFYQRQVTAAGKKQGGGDDDFW